MEGVRFKRGLFSCAQWIPFALGLCLVLYQLIPVEGKMGHDYYHYFARLSIGALHFWQNFLDIPHYTASLCGGIPFFADPQSMYYSIPQFLTFFIDPLLATQITVFLFYCLGYWGFWKLLREIFHCHRLISHMGALFFLLNGFTFSHFLVGHMTHHPYLLFPWLFYLIFKSTTQNNQAFLTRVALFSLILIYTFYSGGLHILVVFSVGFLLVLPCLLYFKIREKSLGQLVRFCLWVALFVIVACSGKFIASYLLSKNFVQSEIDSSRLGIFSLGLQYFWFDPDATPLTIRFGKWHFGPWEYVGFVSKLLIPFLLLLCMTSLLKLKTIYLSAIYLALGCLVLLIASGSELNTLIPFLKSYHNPIKILGAGIPILILGGAIGLSRISRHPWFQSISQKTAVVLFVLAGLILVSEFYGYSNYFLRNPLVFGYRYSPRMYEVLSQRGKLAPVTKVTNKYHEDIRGVFTGCTSLKCYEPMFGYRRDALKVKLVEGSTLLVRDGKFNLTHPGCLLYPHYFGCQPWDRIPVGDKQNLSLFIRGETNEWGVPLWQNILLGLNLGTILFLVSVFGWASLVEIWIGLRKIGFHPQAEVQT